MEKLGIFLRNSDSILPKCTKIVTKIVNVWTISINFNGFLDVLVPINLVFNSQKTDRMKLFCSQINAYPNAVTLIDFAP